ncbi:MAG: metal-dependent hydrolase [Thermoguttaceae bacterium]|jgi:membrane-bound metal-dependent hydrolase YbcI (DUF457 family)
MPGYQTHISCATMTGVGLGLVARYVYHAPLSEAVFGAALCSLGGILPDIDSDQSKSHKRCMTTIAGTTALLLACRLRDYMLTPETVLLISALVFFILYYGVSGFIRKFTVHRGMVHSLPFAVICSEIIYILSTGSTRLRLFKSACVFIGVIVHLTLDELASARLINPGQRSSYSNSGGSSRGSRSRSGSGRYRVKKSFGTALKLIDYRRMGSTIFFYALVVILGNVAINVQTAPSQFGDANLSELRGKAAIDRMKTIYPKQFDLSVVQWVAENDFVLTPGADDNAKWRELEELLALSNDTSSTESSESVATDSGAKSGLTLLDVVNWNSMNTPNPRNQESTTSE